MDLRSSTVDLIHQQSLLVEGVLQAAAPGRSRLRHTRSRCSRRSSRFGHAAQSTRQRHTHNGGLAERFAPVAHEHPIRACCSCLRPVRETLTVKFFFDVAAYVHVVVGHDAFAVVEPFRRTGFEHIEVSAVPNTLNSSSLGVTPSWLKANSPSYVGEPCVKSLSIVQHACQNLDGRCTSYVVADRSVSALRAALLRPRIRPRSPRRGDQQRRPGRSSQRPS